MQLCTLIVKQPKVYHSTSEIGISCIVRKSIRMLMIYAPRIYPIQGCSVLVVGVEAQSVLKVQPI